MTSHRGLTHILIDLPLRLPFQVTLTCHTAAGDCQEVGFFFMDILRGHQQLPALASVWGKGREKVRSKGCDSILLRAGGGRAN